MRSIYRSSTRFGNVKNRFSSVCWGVIAALTGLAPLGDVSGQPVIPRVGIVAVDTAPGSPAAGNRSDLIRKALMEQGWIDGENVSIVVRNARGNASGFEKAVSELVRLEVDAIWADGTPALRAAQTATRTIPIVVNDYTTDPVAEGYAESYRRPGGNVTGVFLDAPAFSGTWLSLLMETIPDMSLVAVLWDPRPGDAHLRALEAISPSFGIELQVLEVRSPSDIDSAGAALDDRAQALIVLPAPMSYAERVRIAELALREDLLAISIFPAFAAEGGSLAYGPDLDAVTRRVAALMTKVLNGEDVGRLPIERPAKFKLLVNQEAAQAIGVTIPQSVLLRADKVLR